MVKVHKLKHHENLFEFFWDDVKTTQQYIIMYIFIKYKYLTMMIISNTLSKFQFNKLLLTSK